MESPGGHTATGYNSTDPRTDCYLHSTVANPVRVGVGLMPFDSSLLRLMLFTVESNLALGALLTLLDMVISSTAWKDSRKLYFLQF